MSTAATKRRVGVISTVVVALVASLLVWFASRSDGEIVRKADLNDGGIWVTNAEQARFGRINKPAGQLDAGVAVRRLDRLGPRRLPGRRGDRRLLQGEQPDRPDQPGRGHPRSEQAIVAAEAEHGHRQPRLHRPPRRPARRDHRDDRPGEGRACGRSASTTARGIAGLDGLQTQAKPLAKVGGNAAVAVGVDGTVYAVSAELGTITVLRPEGDAFADAGHDEARLHVEVGPGHGGRRATGSSGTPAPASSTPTRSPSPSSSRSATPSPATRPSPRCSSPAPTRRRCSSRTRPS